MPKSKNIKKRKSKKRLKSLRPNRVSLPGAARTPPGDFKPEDLLPIQHRVYRAMTMDPQIRRELMLLVALDLLGSDAEVRILREGNTIRIVHVRQEKLSNGQEVEDQGASQSSTEVLEDQGQEIKEVEESSTIDEQSASDEEVTEEVKEETTED